MNLTTLSKLGKINFLVYFHTVRYTSTDRDTYPVSQLELHVADLVHSLCHLDILLERHGRHSYVS